MSALPVILDMDPGVDDALAMMLALASPELRVLGISTVSGNVALEIATRNALKVLEFAGRTEVPVYGGARRPLARDPVRATEVHGPGGLGEAVLPEPEIEVAGDATEFLVGALSGSPGKITLVATGPLTNLAEAEGRCPGILREARRIIVMGGAIEEPGNVTPTAEFNFYADPEAAHRVVHSGAALLLVPLDATHRVWLDAEAIERRIQPVESREARFVAAAVRPAVVHSKRVCGFEGIYLHDPLAVGAAIAPELIRTALYFVDVETEGRLTTGQVVADRRTFLDDANRQGCSVECAVDVEAGRFVDLLVQRVIGGS